MKQDKNIKNIKKIIEKTLPMNKNKDIEKLEKT